MDAPDPITATTSAAEQRVNARLDATAQQQLKYLTQVTGRSVSHVLRESVARYYLQVRQQNRPASKFLAMAGQASSGFTDTASRVKEVVAEAIDDKFARSHRPPKPTPRARKR
jgi:predicted LPLAT superfamily acyltransferase